MTTIELNRNYTQHPEKWINDKIHRDMEIIREEILKVIKPISIILIGSFGRGEGSILVRDNIVLPLRDYDILLVLNKKIPHYELQKITENAHKRLGYENPINRDFTFSDFVISILPITLNDLRHLCDLKMYDIKTGSKILYGEDVRKEIKLSLDDVPLSGGARFLFHKIIGLTALFSPKHLQNPLSGHEMMYLNCECGKTYIEMGTALALISGIYKPTYSERCEMIKKNFKHHFSELSEKIPHLSERISFFTYLKLFPDEKTYNEIDVVKLWFDMRRDLGVVLKYYMNRYLDVKGKDWMEFSEDCYKKMKKEDLKGIISYYLKIKFNINNMFLMRITNFLYQKYFSLRYILKLYRDEKILLIGVMREFPIYIVFTSSMLLLFSLNEDGTLNESVFNSFITSLCKIYPVKIKGSNAEERWNEAVDYLLKAHDINGKLLYGIG